MLDSRDRATQGVLCMGELVVQDRVVAGPGLVRSGLI